MKKSNEEAGKTVKKKMESVTKRGAEYCKSIEKIYGDDETRTAREQAHRWLKQAGYYR